jgi:thioredoxin 2
LAGQAALVQVNTEENPSLASRFEVKGIPVMMLLRWGKVVDRLQGARALEEVLSWFRRVA